jgi:DNA-directed RNA polymerase subunit RPC12/RpoP
MSDVRFACPYCGQHIACDRSYSGNAIDCPSCGARITVPQVIHIVSERTPIPVALPTPRERDLGLWSEEVWRKHVRQTPDIYELDDRSRWTMPQLPVVLAIVLPFLVVRGATPPLLWTVMVISALITGYITRRQFPNPGQHPILAAGFFFVGILYYAILAEVFLLGGCCWPGHSFDI